ncbi:MAG: glycosyltransferase family 2 protein [Bacteroidetes bacterium]|nr:glycosyltransferase family 2 protein [Bacteroidota bacterium]
MNEKPTVICITPVKNEAWILEQFLTATSLWADHIIIADQNSNDNSREIAARFPKARVVNNPGQYNEYERTRLLLKEARSIPGPRLIMALDADEFLAADYAGSDDWQRVLEAAPGTIIQMERVNIAPGFKQYFNPINMVLGLMDDNVATIETTSKANIHNIRVPWPTDAQVLKLNQLKALHIDAIDYGRVISKLRWYQVFERTVNKKETFVLLNKYKCYDNEAEFLRSLHLQPVREEWFAGYDAQGLHLRDIRVSASSYWWDAEVLQFLDQNGTNDYRLLNIWGKDWVEAAKSKNLKDPARFRNTQGPLDRWVYRYWYRHAKNDSKGVPVINSILNRLGYH